MQVVTGDRFFSPFFFPYDNCVFYNMDDLKKYNSDNTPNSL